LGTRRAVVIAHVALSGTGQTGALPAAVRVGRRVRCRAGGVPS